MLNYVFLIILNTLLLTFFFFNDTATTEIYTLSLHDALPILLAAHDVADAAEHEGPERPDQEPGGERPYGADERASRSEEHTSELQSQSNLVCRLLLEKKKKNYRSIT